MAGDPRLDVRPLLAVVADPGRGRREPPRDALALGGVARPDRDRAVAARRARRAGRRCRRRGPRRPRAAGASGGATKRGSSAPTHDDLGRPDRLRRAPRRPARAPRPGRDRALDGHEPPGGRGVPAERRPQRRLDHLLARRALEHEQRAEPVRRGQVDDAPAARVERRPSPPTSVTSSPGTPARRNTPRRRSPAAPASRITALPASSDAAVSSTGSHHGEADGPRRPTTPDRRPHDPRAAPDQPRGARDHAPVGERPRAEVGERVQAAHGRQQLRQHDVLARPAGLLRQQAREVVELVEHRHRRAPDVARPRGDGHERPQRLRGQLRRHGPGPPGSGPGARAARGSMSPGS